MCRWWSWAVKFDGHPETLDLEDSCKKIPLKNKMEAARGIEDKLLKPSIIENLPSLIITKRISKRIQVAIIVDHDCLLESLQCKCLMLCMVVWFQCAQFYLGTRAKIGLNSLGPASSWPQVHTSKLASKVAAGRIMNLWYSTLLVAAKLWLWLTSDNNRALRLFIGIKDSDHNWISMGIQTICSSWSSGKHKSFW